jgi:hypothetical protein
MVIPQKLRLELDHTDPPTPLLGVHAPEGMQISMH